MKIDPRHLEILASIIDHGGLTEGANAIGRTQPSVSRTVVMLEARIGAPLFEKSRRPLVPTELCLALAAEGRKILSASATASAIVATYKAGHRGIVRLGGTPIFMDGVISSILAGFQQSHPEIRIEQSYAYAPELMDGLSAGTLDLAICPINTDALPGGFEFISVMPGRNVIACGAMHPLLSKKGHVKLSDLSSYPWIAPPVSSPLYRDMRHILTEIGMKDFKISFSGGSLASITTILAQSDALTVLPYSVVFMARRQQTLAALSIRIGHPERSLGILFRQGDAERPAVRRLRRYVETEFRNLSQAIMQHEQNNLWRA
ncbi:LysR family transcriptional regulator [Brucella anthropi]|uniref:LysR family transcriptional regulator n=1 Tax=Brucella anthropi TaxID=529 RepID=UPI0039887D2D